MTVWRSSVRCAMNGNKWVLDTSVIINFLGGAEDVLCCLSHLASRNMPLYASEITEMELLSWPAIGPKDEREITRFLENVNIQPINAEIKMHTIALRRITRQKLPDAIIAATAICLHAPLITSDLTLAATIFPGFHAFMPDEIAMGDSGCRR